MDVIADETATHGNPTPMRRFGIYFFGMNGMLWANSNDHRIVAEGKAMNDFIRPAALSGNDSIAVRFHS